MAETVKVNLEENSKYRVSLELTQMIFRSEQIVIEDPREYFLLLYRQCYNTVSGYDDMKDVLAQKR